MRVDLFDFDLPEERIALRPAVPREAARLLDVPTSGLFADRTVHDLPDLIRQGDALVFNDTRVVPARLHGTRTRNDVTARIEILLHGRVAPDRWRAFARPAKRLAVGDSVGFGACEAEILERGEGGDVLLAFDRAGPALDAAVASVGEVPLPPYIAGRRATDARDAADYQTHYAREDGAVAAPTAGLHFTEDLARRVERAGATRHFVTLHVGAGTFLPVKAEETGEHRMHAEWGVIDAATADALNETRRQGGRIVAVGTTSLRLLESAAGPDGIIRPFSGWTDIFITPGYRFRAVDVLMTNFHLPRSTLFMLVSAFAGLERMRDAYAHAVASGYRFYSYGDACLIERASA